MSKNTKSKIPASRPFSYIEISKANLLHNFRLLKKHAPRGTKVAAVVKANAYGHGLPEVVQTLEHDADCFQVNSVSELRTVRLLTKKPIMVLGYVSVSELDKALAAKPILAVYGVEHLEAINDAAAKKKIIQPVHVTVDSHLGRDGVLPDELSAFLKKAKTLKNIKLTGIYSHFANIEDTSSPAHAQKQIQTYQSVLELCKNEEFSLDTHISATSGLLVYEKDAKNTIARVGIGMYGLWPSSHLQQNFEKKQFQLKPVLRWVSHIAQVKTLPANHSIGYGLTYVTEKPTKIAVIPQGYGDGYDRRFSGCGEVLIQGKMCKVLGRVSMNMFVVDVSHLPKVKAEEEVVLLGTQKGKTVSAEDLAETIGTINYEMTTMISSLLPRLLN